MRRAEFVESYFDAWNHRDPKGIADHLSADGTYRDVPENLQRSPDELIISLNDFFSKYRHRYELTGEIQKSQNTIAFQYRMFPYRHKRSGDAMLSYHGAEFMTFNGEAAMEITDYYDIPVRTQLRKYAKSGLTDDQLDSYKHRLNQIMHRQQEYLKPELTLPKLAEAVGCSVNHLSQVINSGFGTSFFNYLNGYRIDHARKLLASLDSEHNAILRIAFTVGFNSSSAFYSAFKKHVGMTPDQYRQTQIQSHL